MDEQLLHGHNDPVRCVALRSNGHVASGSDDGSIIIHSTSSNSIENRANNVLAGEVNGLCYLPNGSLVACGEVGLKVFSPSLELVQTLVGHVGPASCVTVSPSGSHFASGGSDGKVMIWSEPGEGGEWARVQVLADHTGWIVAVCFSPDGKQLVTGSYDVSHQPTSTASTREVREAISRCGFPSSGNLRVGDHSCFASSHPHAPGAPTLEMSSGDEVATHWLPSSLVRSSPVSHAGSEGVNQC